jgi:hypothetical protein
MTAQEQSANEPERGEVWPVWLPGWLGAPALAVLNGAAREKLYKERVGDLAAHQISTAGLIALLTPYLWLLQRRRPLPDTRTALRVGAVWAALAVLFELGMGRARRVAWSKLLGDYDIRKGRVWSLVLLWTALGPATIRALSIRGPAARPLDS